MIATLVKAEMANWNSDARLYKLDSAFDGHHYVAVERWDAIGDFGPETHVYAAYPNGGAVAHPGGGLSPQRRYFGELTHEDALAELGYEVSS